MADNNDKLGQLLHKLDSLLIRHDAFSKEIHSLKAEILSLRTHEVNQENQEDNTQLNHPIHDHDFVLENDTNPLFEVPSDDIPSSSIQTEQLQKSTRTRSSKKSDLEKFVGENLINKIGIVITIIGVAIGAKYSIDNDLINPLTRIILSYVFGLGLLGFGIKSKLKYENYSAVLVSGAIAIMYFTTYFAYNFYDLMPQIVAFALMVIFTICTVIAAIQYNRAIIAHIGIVGAYAIPFLLSEGSGQVGFLFSYMAILNTGILTIAFKKYWKSLYYISFALTWIIFVSWVFMIYQAFENFYLALVFNSIFFIIFYITFLAYKLLQKEKFVVNDIVLITLNSIIFYATGYAILFEHHIGNQLLGIYTLMNACIHFVVSFIIYKQKLIDNNIQYFTGGLVFVFIVLTIPVQLDGHWVTSLWAVMAALLFWIGRTKNILYYEKLSYLLMICAFYSILHDWGYAYASYDHESPSTHITAIFNVYFLTSMIVLAAFGFIHILNQKHHYHHNSGLTMERIKNLHIVILAILIVISYYAGRIEIETYWDQLYIDSVIRLTNGDENTSNVLYDNDIKKFKSLWIINYSLLFVSILMHIYLKKIKHSIIGHIIVGCVALSICIFLIIGLYNLSELRASYLYPTSEPYYSVDSFNVLMRYISLLFVALALYSLYKYIKEEQNTQRYLRKGFDLFLHITIVWIVSSELIQWMDIFRSDQSYKFGLSILWGSYALLLIAYGIWKKHKHLRIAAIGLFALTLIKLFTYDISYLNNIAKTILFVSLGILLLIISFLYNKYKHLITENESTVDETSVVKDPDVDKT